MAPSTAELLKALPADLEEEIAPPDSITDLMARLAHRPVPTGRLYRMWTLGTLQGRIAAGYFAWYLRTFATGAAEKQRRLDEAHLKAALRLLGTMSYLRGAIMKAGQILANYPDVVPAQFVELLGRLYFEAPPMHFSMLRERFHSELGRDPEDVFDEFETEAFAAASLGQVHRARLKGTDRRVAVKIQYPGIDRTIRDDFRNLRAIAMPMRLSRDWDNILDQFDEVRRMLEIESDYEQEIEHQDLARRTLSEFQDIVVPRFYPELSSRRVLTMDFIEGVHLDRFLDSNPPQETRDRYGRLIAVATNRLSYRSHLLYADPHPGNYIFMPDGRLGLIDFGCCYRYRDTDLDYLTQMERAMFGSEQDHDEVILRAIDLPDAERIKEDHLRLVKRWCDWSWEPLLHDGPFDFGDRSYFARGVELFGEVVKRRYLRSRPLNTWINKNFLGLRAMLTHLEARVDLGEIMRAETTAR